MIIGVLPGLGPAATIAILLPTTYTIDPVAAIIMLADLLRRPVRRHHHLGAAATPRRSLLGGHRLRRLRAGQAG
ncbi:MAG: tripartite tricarboxylate transporter permease, partial [Mycobacterium sp.]|nr:tripartite tricarboxylate transporter permease [Mycobacterium sp.]